VRAAVIAVLLALDSWIQRQLFRLAVWLAAAAAAAAAAYRLFPYWASWYMHPRYALWRMARWRMFMPADQPNPWEPLVELFRLGVAPIGYRWIDGEVVFCVYVPPAVAATKEAA
jgi:hypothetical protein